jgi:hypothetical protein
MAHPNNTDPDEANEIIMVINAKELLSNNEHRWKYVPIKYTDDSVNKITSPLSRFSLSFTNAKGEPNHAVVFIFSGRKRNINGTLSVSDLLTKIKINASKPEDFSALITHYQLTDTMFHLTLTSSVYINDTLYIMGGRNMSLENYYNPHILMISGFLENKLEYSHARLFSQVLPFSRRNHQMVVSLGKIWVFGMCFFFFMCLFIGYTFFFWLTRRLWRWLSNIIVLFILE